MHTVVRTRYPLQLQIKINLNELIAFYLLLFFWRPDFMKWNKSLQYFISPTSYLYNWLSPLFSGRFSQTHLRDWIFLLIQNLNWRRRIMFCCWWDDSIRWIYLQRKCRDKLQIACLEYCLLQKFVCCWEIGSNIFMWSMILVWFNI